MLESTWPGAEAVAVAAPTGPRVETNESSVRVEYPVTGRRRRPSRPNRGADARPRVIRRWARSTVVNDAAGRLWRSRVDGFWQVHPAAPDTLVAAVLDVLDAAARTTSCGICTPASACSPAPSRPLVDRVMAVESESDACRDAERNLNDLPQVKVVQAPGGSMVAPGRARQPRRDPDVVVLDPPRKGAGAAIVERDRGACARGRSRTSRATPPRWPATSPCSRPGLRLDWLEAFDLFPMTHHVECVAGFVPPG